MAETDRELLEMAAKAAGIELDFESDPWGRAMRVSDGVVTTVWNPLGDDGDALRLAIALAMHINIEGMELGYRIGGVLDFERIVLTDSGLEDATRRAIVRAAAEIGKGCNE